MGISSVWLVFSDLAGVAPDIPKHHQTSPNITRHSSYSSKHKTWVCIVHHTVQVLGSRTNSNYSTQVPRIQRSLSISTPTLIHCPICPAAPFWSPSQPHFQGFPRHQGLPQTLSDLLGDAIRATQNQQQPLQPRTIRCTWRTRPLLLKAFEGPSGRGEPEMWRG